MPNSESLGLCIVYPDSFAKQFLYLLLSVALLLIYFFYNSVRFYFILIIVDLYCVLIFSVYPNAVWLSRSELSVPVEC